MDVIDEGINIGLISLNLPLSLSHNIYLSCDLEQFAFLCLPVK